MRYRNVSSEIDRIARSRGNCAIAGSPEEPVLELLNLGWTFCRGKLTGQRWLWHEQSIHVIELMDDSWDPERCVTPVAIWHHDTTSHLGEWPDGTLLLYTRSPLRARLAALCDGATDDDSICRWIAAQDRRRAREPMSIVEQALAFSDAIVRDDVRQAVIVGKTAAVSIAQSAMLRAHWRLAGPTTMTRGPAMVELRDTPVLVPFQLAWLVGPSCRAHDAARHHVSKIFAPEGEVL